MADPDNASFKNEIAELDVKIKACVNEEKLLIEQASTVQHDIKTTTISLVDLQKKYRDLAAKHRQLAEKSSKEPGNTVLKKEVVVTLQKMQVVMRQITMLQKKLNS